MNKILMIGGSFNDEGGRRSGYFAKFSKAFSDNWPNAPIMVINGGFYSELLPLVEGLTNETHLLWFADVPNDKPKLLSDIKVKKTNLVLVQSKNNRKGLYTPSQLFERMALSRADHLVEFTEDTAGKLLAGVYAYPGTCVLEASLDIDKVARVLATNLVKSITSTSCRKSVCLIGRTGPVSEGLRSKLAQVPNLTVSVLSAQDALAIKHLHLLPKVSKADLIILCAPGLVSPQLLNKLPSNSRILDISPAFRQDSGWAYGMPELMRLPSQLSQADRVANPGCFASSAILLLEPLQREGLLNSQNSIYLDGVSGYSTGGAKFEERFAQGNLPVEAVHSLNQEHLHIGEIKHHTGFKGEMWFTPKVAAYYSGLRMQIPLYGVAYEAALSAYQSAYINTKVEVVATCPSKVTGDEWAGKSGARIYLAKQAGGVLVLCVMDNIIKGAVETAMWNIRQMLAL